jgi:hypothetical protein
MTNSLMTEASLAVEPLGSDDAPLTYVLLDVGAWEALSEGPSSIEAVLATTDLDAAHWLAEGLPRPTVVAAIRPEGMALCELGSAVDGEGGAARSVAASGFCSLSGVLDPSFVERLTPTDDDLAETIVDALGALTGRSWDAAARAGSRGKLSAWSCSSPTGDAAIVLSDGSELRPWRPCLPDKVAGMVPQALDSWEDAAAASFWSGRTDEAVMLTEYARRKTAGTARLKRVAMDALVSAEGLPGKLRDVSVSGDEMTIKVGRRTYWFDVDRDADGWVTGVRFSRPASREGEVAFVKEAISAAFKEASFKQALEDACSEAKPKLAMLDYVLQHPGPTGHPRRRTRLIEPYSYRRKSSTKRRYCYGWNVEEGGIRSYIVDNVKGARKTDRTFRPRFLVEIGAGRRLRAGIAQVVRKDLPATVSAAAVRRGHERFELAGGRGKIIRRLGHSVSTSKKKK